MNTETPNPQLKFIRPEYLPNQTFEDFIRGVHEDVLELHDIPVLSDLCAFGMMTFIYALVHTSYFQDQIEYGKESFRPIFLEKLNSKEWDSAEEALMACAYALEEDGMFEFIEDAVAPDSLLDLYRQDIKTLLDTYQLPYIVKEED